MNIDLATFGFGEPLALVALLILPLALLAGWNGRVRRRATRAALGGAPGLYSAVSPRRRVLASAALVTGMAFAVLAAARPQWGEGDREVAQAGIDIVIALDVSRSMEAQDIAPSRADAASAGLAEMLTHLTGNRVGLVTFAGSAFERAPLTVDLDVLASLIARSQAESPLVQPGTDIAAAIAAARNVLEVDEPASAQAIVLISDGEDTSDDLDDEIARAERAGITIYTVFAGTTNPTALPAESGGTDVSTANPETLERIAAITGGDTRSVERIAGLAVEFRRLQQTQFDTSLERRPIDRFPWFVGIALAFVALAWVIGERGSRATPRLRGGVIVASMLALIAAGCGTAAWSHVETGNEAYAAADYEDALSEYRQAVDAAPGDPAINYNIANTLHNLGRYEEADAAAEQARTSALQVDDLATAFLAQYTIGNTAFVRGQLEDARDAYVAALRLDPTDRDAKANLELVLMLMTPPEEEPDTGPGEGPDGTQPEGTPDPDATQQPGQPGPGQPQPGGTPDPAATQQPGQPQPGSGDGEGQLTAIEAARLDLQEALGELGPEVSQEEALRIIELTRRLNALEGLPTGEGGGVPAR